METDAKENSKLRAEYTAAEAEERAAWRHLNNSSLEEGERSKWYARWKVAASLTKVLAIKLHEAATHPGNEGTSGSSIGTEPPMGV